MQVAKLLKGEDKVNEIKKIARAEIEFDAQGLEDGRIEFELEAEKWLAFRGNPIEPHVRGLAEEILALRSQYDDISFEEAVKIISLAGSV